MKLARMILLAAGALALANPAFAQTVTKAPPISNVYPTKGCGAFYGVNGEGSSAVVNGAPGGTVAIGGDIGGLVGWACPSASIPWFFEADFDFQNLNAGNAGFSMTGPAHFTQVAAVQTPLLSWFGQFINVGQGNINTNVQSMLPPGVTVNGSPQNYVGATLTEDDVSATYGGATARQWLVSPGIRTGLLFNLTGPNGTQAIGDSYVGLDFQSSGACVGVAGGCSKLGTRYVVGFSLKM